MKRKMLAGTTSVSIPIFIPDSTSSSGAGVGSLVYNSSGLAARYRRHGASSFTSITLATKTLGTWTSGGFVTTGGTTGTYELDLPNAAVASGARWVTVEIYGATNAVAVLVEIELDAVDYQDSQRFGLGALPSSNTLAVDSSGRVTVGSNADKTNYGLADGAITDAKITQAACEKIANEVLE